MIHLMFGLAVILVVYNLFKESRPSKMPPNAYWDWDEYWQDVENGMSSQQQLKKIENYGYYKSKTK